jgi:voltage-gated potassium channel
VDFVDLIIRRKELALFMEEFVVKTGARIAGQTLKSCDLRRVANVIVVATKKPGEDIIFNPSPDIKIEKGDTLLVLGTQEDISRFEQNYL